MMTMFRLSRGKTERPSSLESKEDFETLKKEREMDEGQGHHQQDDDDHQFTATREWRVTSKAKHRPSMFSEPEDKVGVLKMLNETEKSKVGIKSTPTRFFVVSGNYIKYFDIKRGRGKRVSWFGRRASSARDKVDFERPIACIDLRLVRARLHPQAESNHEFQIQSLVSDDFMDVKAASFEEAKDWVEFIIARTEKAEIAAKRRSERLSAEIDQVTPGHHQPRKPKMNRMKTTYDYIDDVVSYSRDDARFCARGLLRGTNRNGFQIVSFNILANHFVVNSREDSIYRHCDSGCLAWEYRLQKILRHLKSTNADLICLQECERSVFNGDIGAVLRSRGYEGEIDCNVKNGKDGSSSFELPGTATFYKKSMFEFAWRERSYRSLVIGLKILKGKEQGNIMAVCNSHLEGAPWKTKDRASQMQSVFKKLDRMKEQHRFVVLCGDYNDGAKSDLCQIVMGSRNFMSAYDNHPERDLTNFLTMEDSKTVDIDAKRVDHIFFDSRLHLRAVMEIVDQRWSRLNLIEQGLPNWTWPSDHLSIGAIFEFNQESEMFKKTLRNSVRTIDPFTVMSSKEIFEKPLINPLSEEEKKEWLTKFDGLLEAMQNNGAGPPSQKEIERRKMKSEEKEQFIQTLAINKQEFLRSYIALQRSELKSKKKKKQ